ncbi:proteasome-type protease [Cognatishimia sp. SS12]|uniref:proteasome-type protease n=1 Tax=Cognatishimia sp. SS12 TaxID=2979465 RepID=UPI00232C6F97|nr:proteasome-type protease [Cognatishimia sp. SS12]MDC0739494.1 proteasome-type protease [Cognatishimia sp. SS12]
MTYCVGLMLNQGLVFMSDTRTNAGVDNISTYRKMFTFDVAGERSITVMTAGNLATTQAVISLLKERSKASDERDPSILKVPTMYQAALLVGETLKEVLDTHAQAGQRADASFNATIILGGQIADGDPTIFLVYPEGNFIEASSDTPFLQIGETKYGRPILVRAFDADMSFEEAVKLLLVSFDSTIKANLGVDLPIDLRIYHKDSLAAGQSLRIGRDDPYYQKISEGWGVALRDAFGRLPAFEFPKS